MIMVLAVCGVFLVGAVAGMILTCLIIRSKNA